MKRWLFAAITSLLMLLVAAGEAEAAGRTVGLLVAAGPDYVVLDTATRGRRLLVLDEHRPDPGLLVPGTRLAATFRVGEDNQLHALELTADPFTPEALEGIAPGAGGDPRVAADRSSAPPHRPTAVWPTWLAWLGLPVAGLGLVGAARAL